MLLPALVLAAITARTELLNEMVKVPPQRVQHFSVELRDKPATIEVAFQVAKGRSGVRVVLMTDEEAKRYFGKQRHTELRSSDFEKAGKFRYLAGNPGRYHIIVENHLEGRDTAEVKLRVGLARHGYESFVPKQLPPGKRRAVVAGSLGAFAVVGLVIGARLWPALRGERQRRIAG